MKIMAGICLLIQSIWDIRTKEIPLWISMCFGGCSFFYSICCHRNWMELALALIPGVICFVLGYCTKEAIGYGDAIILCALGMLYSLEEMLIICVIAVILAGVIGLIMLVVFHKNGKYEIPFVPFMFLGWMSLFFGEMAGGIVS